MANRVINVFLIKRTKWNFTFNPLYLWHCLSFVNPKLGKSESSIPLSAIEQVSLQAGGFSAEYGNYRSGILNVITRSGSKERYHGTFSYSRNRPHMKRFGKSLYDPDNYGLRPYMDPEIAFIGTSDGWLTVTGGNEEEAEFLSQQYENFRGWNAIADRYNRNLPEDEQVTPIDLYLWSAWIHQAVLEFEKLEELYPQYPITDEQKKVLRDHAHKPEDEYADWYIAIDRPDQEIITACMQGYWRGV